jgi:tetratricopeptide (TPR) repeat protein
MAERAVADLEKALGPDNPYVLSLLHNLAALYVLVGDYARAEPLYRRVLTASEKALGPEHPDVALTLSGLATLYITMRDYARAEPLYLRAVVISEKAFGRDSTEVATLLNNLALLYFMTGKYSEAEALYQRSLSIDQKSLGSEHPRVATSLSNLGMLYAAKGDYARAEPLYRHALAIREKVFGPTRPEVAELLTKIAEMYFVERDYDKATPLFHRALAIIEQSFGPNHPLLAASLNNLAALYTAKKEIPEAVQFATRAGEVHERNLSLALSMGSERQKLLYLANLSFETSSTISLHTRSAPDDLAAARLALTAVLRRKGRALDAMSNQVASLRRRLDPPDRALLDQLTAAQSRLSNLSVGDSSKTPPEEYRTTVSKLQEEIERLQDAISRRSAEFRVQTQPVTVEQVRLALPEGAGLIEFVSYRPFNANAITQAQPLVPDQPTERFGPARYVAYVLLRNGEPQWADLGAAEAIDASVVMLRAALKNPMRKDVKKLARDLDERVMRPVRKLLGETRHVFLSPDGALNLVPFAALVDEQGKYLVETYSLTYLTSGRDLLRLQLNSQSRQPPLVVADPLFGSAPAITSGTRGGRIAARRSADMGRMYFRRLPGTAEEARALVATLPGVTVLTQAQATEAVLKKISGPSVLHVATHGFFLPDLPPRAEYGTRAIKLGADGGPPASIR